MAQGLRIAVLGVGRIGASHTVVVRDHPEVSEVVIVDADHHRAETVARELGVSTAPSITALAGEVDGVLIATATATHAEAILTCLPWGVPIFCEKPVALDLAATLHVIDAVESSGAVVQIGFQRRFDAGYRKARELVRSGELGQVHRIHTLTCDPVPPPESFVVGSGGLFVDCLVHDVDAIRWITGAEILRVHAAGANRGPAYIGEAGDVDEAVVILELDDGTVATSHLSRGNAAGYDVRMELAGSRLTAAVGLDARMPLVSCEPGVAFPPPGPRWGNFWERFEPAYEAEISAFVDLVAGRGELAATPRDALASLLVAQAATRSRAEGRPVEVPEVSGISTTATSPLLGAS